MFCPSDLHNGGMPFGTILEVAVLTHEMNDYIYLLLIIYYTPRCIRYIVYFVNNVGRNPSYYQYR